MNATADASAPTTLTKLRRKLLANGYTPLPNVDKMTVLKGWPTVAPDEATIRKWDRNSQTWPATGLRVENGLAVVDVDADDQDLVDAFARLVEERHPEIFRTGLVRLSRPVREAWFVRTSEIFEVYRSRKWIKPGESKVRPRRIGQEEWDKMSGEERELKGKNKWHRLEVYGGGTPKQFGAFGPHSHNPDGSVAFEYRWADDASPANTKLSELPVLAAADLAVMADLFDEAAAGLGFEPLPPTERAGGSVLWTLTEDTVLETLQDGVMTVAEAKEWADDTYDSSHRCSWAFAEDGHDNPMHCSVRYTERFGLEIYVHDEGLTYREAIRKPPDPHEIGQQVQELLDREAPVPDNDDDLEWDGASLDGIEIDENNPAKTLKNATDWMLANCALCQEAFSGRGGIIPIHGPGSAVTPQYMRMRMRPFDVMEIGPKGGLKRVSALDRWLDRREKVEVVGVRMRPDKPRPRFVEDREQYVNTYRPPRHPIEGADIGGFITWMERLVPDPVERAWFMNWLAYKVKNPGARMVAVIMVAAESGTGRGLLCAALARLFGREYVVPTTFAKLTGGPGSRFNAELADRLIVYVDESRDSDADRWMSNMAAYEALKVFVEPNGDIDQAIEGKGVNVTYRRLSVSTFIASNNLNVVKLPDSDRRFAVFGNGRQATHDERAEFIRWMDNPANIGALWRHLKAMPSVSDPEIFDPYMAPRTHARGLVVEANKNESELAWEDAVARISRVAGIYSMTQVMEIARRWPGANAPGQTSFRFDEQVKAHTRHHGHRIGVLQGKNWLVRYRGLKERVYAVDPARRDDWTAANPREIKRELDKVQAIVGSSSAAFTAGLSSISEGRPVTSADDEDKLG